MDVLYGWGCASVFSSENKHHRGWELLQKCSSSALKPPLRRRGNIKESNKGWNYWYRAIWQIWSVGADASNVVKSSKLHHISRLSSLTSEKIMPLLTGISWKAGHDDANGSPPPTAQLREDVIDEDTAGELRHAWRLTAESPSLVCPHRSPWRCFMQISGEILLYWRLWCGCSQPLQPVT